MGTENRLKSNVIRNLYILVGLDIGSIGMPFCLLSLPLSKSDNRDLQLLQIPLAYRDPL